MTCLTVAVARRRARAKCPGARADSHSQASAYRILYAIFSVRVTVRDRFLEVAALCSCLSCCSGFYRPVLPGRLVPPAVVGPGAGACQRPARHDQVLLAGGVPGHEVFEDLAGAGRVAGLGRQAGAGDVRCHRLVGHRPPRVVGGRRLRVPDVAGIAGQLAGLERGDDDVPHHDLGPGGVDDVGTAAHRADQLGVEQVVSLRVQRGVDGRHVDCAGERGGVGADNEPPDR